MTDSLNKEQEQEKTIGEFKTSRNYTNFVSSFRGVKVRLLRKEATFDASDVYGMLEGVKLKLTICDENTVNLEEVSDTDLTDTEMRKRILDDIDSYETIMYSQKSVIRDIKFSDMNGDPCYLGVEYKTPFERMRDLTSDTSVSSKAKSILDSIFGDEDSSNTDTETETDTEVESSVKDEISADESNSDSKSVEESESMTMLREKIEREKKEKKADIINRIEDITNDINMYKTQKKSADAKLDELSGQLSILNSRLDSMDILPEPNGYVFFVSEEKKSDVGITEENREIADKIADMIGLKKDVLFDRLTGGHYEISLAHQDDINAESEISMELINKIKTLDPIGKFSINKGKLVYKGELTWHKIVDRMLRLGFTQDEEFDRISGSNSYKENQVKE
jgi:DNA-binding protein H-NS